MPKSKDVKIKSKGRKFREIWFIQKYSNGSFQIDDGKVHKTAKGHLYIFHLVDEKIEHFWKVKPGEIKDWEMDDYQDPEDWCDACQALSSEYATFEIPF